MQRVKFSPELFHIYWRLSSTCSANRNSSVKSTLLNAHCPISIGLCKLQSNNPTHSGKKTGRCPSACCSNFEHISFNCMVGNWLDKSVIPHRSRSLAIIKLASTVAASLPGTTEAPIHCWLVNPLSLSHLCLGKSISDGIIALFLSSARCALGHLHGISFWYQFAWYPLGLSVMCTAYWWLSLLLVSIV